MGYSYNQISYELLGPTVVGSYSSCLDTFAAILATQGFSNPTVLDIAAGSGIFAEYLNVQTQCVVTALDSSPDSLQHTNTEKIHCRLGQINPKRKYDGIHTKDSYGFDIDPADFLNIVSTIITPSGILMISAVANADYTKKMHSDASKRGFTILKESTWVPKHDERDWYKARVPRSVHYYVKS